MKRSGTPEYLSSPPVRPFVSLFLLLVAAASLSACRNTATSAIPPAAVDVMEAIRRDVPIYQEWIGTADGMVNATIRAQVTGYLTRQDYKEGDFVRSGQVLFEIDPRTFQAALDQAEAQESQARGQLAQAEAQHTNALANLDRIRPLADQNAVSKKDLDDAIGAEGSSQAVIVAARGNVAAARAAVEKARLDLGFTKITSPIDGIAGIAKAQVGNLVGPAQGGELTTVSKIDPIKVYFTTSEQAYIVSRRQFAKRSDGVRARQGAAVRTDPRGRVALPRQGEVLRRRPAGGREDGYTPAGGAVPESGEPDPARAIRPRPHDGGNEEGRHSRPPEGGVRAPGDLPGGGGRPRQPGGDPQGQGRGADRGTVGDRRRDKARGTRRGRGDPEGQAGGPGHSETAGARASGEA